MDFVVSLDIPMFKNWILSRKFYYLCLCTDSGSLEPDHRGKLQRATPVSSLLSSHKNARRLEILQNSCVSLSNHSKGHLKKYSTLYPLLLLSDTSTAANVLYRGCSSSQLLMCRSTYVVLVPVEHYRNCIRNVLFADTKSGMIHSQKQNWYLHARITHPNATVFCTTSRPVHFCLPVFLTHPNTCHLPY